MVIEHVRYNIPEEDLEAFDASYSRAESALRASEHCRGWELSRCRERPSLYILRTEWLSVDAHDHSFRDSDEFSAFFAEVGPYVGHIEERRFYDPTAVRST